MHPITRKILAIVTGILTFLVLAFLPFFAPLLLRGIANSLSSNQTEKVFGAWTYDTVEISNFYFYYEFALISAIAMTITYIIWDFKDKFRRRLFIYTPFMIIILVFTGYNYSHFDLLIKPDIQVILNLVLIFLVSVCLIQIWKLKTKSSDGQVLKYLIFFLIFLFGLCLPSFFSICWLTQRLGISELIFNINMPILTTISGVITTIVTVYKYKDDKKKEKMTIINTAADKSIGASGTDTAQHQQ